MFTIGKPEGKRTLGGPRPVTWDIKEIDEQTQNKVCNSIMCHSILYTFLLQYMQTNS